MEVEQIIVQQKSFSELMTDPSTRVKIIKVVIQTLYNLGYEKSAKQLQKESGIIYLSEDIARIKQAMLKNNFKEIWNLIPKIPIKSIEDRRIVQQNLSILQCQVYIQSKKTSKALEVLHKNRQKISQKKANELCQKLTFFQFLPENDQAQKLHQKQCLLDDVLEKCLQNDIQPRSMQKIILFYLKLQKEGLIEALDEGFSLLNLDQSRRQPPMKIVSISKEGFQQKIQFIKFNAKGNLFCTVGSGSSIQIRIYQNPVLNQRQYQSLSAVKKQQRQKAGKYQFRRLCQRQIEQVQETHHNNQQIHVQCVSWSDCQDILAVCTKKRIYVFDCKLNELSKIEFSQFSKNSVQLSGITGNNNNNTNNNVNQNRNNNVNQRNQPNTINLNKGQRLLCVKFNPISNLIYCCGHFNYILATSYQGEQVARLQSFTKTRQIVFNISGTKMYAISLTTPKLTLVSLFNQKQQGSFTPFQSVKNQISRAPFMSVSIQKHSGKVIVTNRDYIYILNETLKDVLKCFASPSNKGNFVLESYIFQPWVVTLGDNFCAQNMLSLTKTPEKSKTNPPSSSSNMISYPGSGAFAIFDDIMISGRQQLILWKSGTPEEGLIMDKQVSSEEQGEEQEEQLQDLDLEDGSEMELQGELESDFDLDS